METGRSRPNRHIKHQRFTGDCEMNMAVQAAMVRFTDTSKDAVSNTVKHLSLWRVIRQSGWKRTSGIKQVPKAS